MSRVTNSTIKLSINALLATFLMVAPLPIAPTSASPLGGLIDFEIPSLGDADRQVIDPYVDLTTGVTFTAEDIIPHLDEVVGLVKNSATSVCVEPPDANQKLGTGFQPSGGIGLSGVPIRATFPTPLAPPATVTAEFQALAGAPLRIRLFDESGAEVAAVVEAASPPDGTCGKPGPSRARTTVTATSAETVAFAIMDIEGSSAYVFVIDNFEFAESPAAQGITIDIKPGDNPNKLNCSADHVLVPVSILTTETFDATSVDHTTVIFEGAGEAHLKKNGHPQRHEEDVDLDGDVDLMLHFRFGDTTLTCESTEAALIGSTFDGSFLQGSDSVQMVP